jgi:hypothetical protein
MPHFFDSADERPDTRKEIPECRAFAETIQVTVERIPFDPQNE